MPSVEPFTAKEILVFVPSAASAIAIAWEVGSFLPIGTGPFMLFSLTEHIQFAFQALPAAMVAASTVVLNFIVMNPAAKMLDRTIDPRIEAIDRSINARDIPGAYAQIAKLRKILRLLAVGLFALGSIVAAYGYFVPRSLTFITMGGATIVAAAAMIFLKPMDISKIKIIWAAAVFVLAMSMAVGADMTRQNLRSGSLFSVDTRSGPISSVLVRSGERGVLLYLRDTGRFIFRKWDDVQSLGWDRSPILAR